jgi:hypothetical protein
MELDVLATEAGWATTDVQEVGSQPDFRVTFARMAARLLREMSRKHRIKDRVDRALGVVKAFSIAVPAGVQLKLDVEAATGVADSGDPEQDASNSRPTRYLAAMASLDSPPYRSAEVAHAYGAKDQRGVSIHRDGLIQKGLIWAPRRGQLDFTVPLFAEFLRENHPLASFEDE